jgi:hypothetical protein
LANDNVNAIAVNNMVKSSRIGADLVRRPVVQHVGASRAAAEKGSKSPSPKRHEIFGFHGKSRRRVLISRHYPALIQMQLKIN